MAWQNFLTFGLQVTEQNREATSVIGPLPFHPEGSDRKLGLYAQGEFIWHDRLILIPGLRVDFGDRTPSAFTPPCGARRPNTARFRPSFPLFIS